MLAPVPNLYSEGAARSYPASAVPEGFRRTTTEILYVTDRRPELDESGNIASYSAKRSDSMSFGVSLVEYGVLNDWTELVSRTSVAQARGLDRLDPVYMQEIARFPATPMPFKAGGGRLQARADLAARYDKKADLMREEVAKRLRTHGLDRVTVYVHGFKNAFEDSIGTLANLWHYTGRQSLPISYSWPAGNAGLFAYFEDVQAGKFTVFHAKEMLRILASIPEVRTIDIVAHSRGAVVMTDALRELLIEARASGGDPHEIMKTGVLILAAADLDLGVARQRLVAERFAQAFEQINVYTNPSDRALKLSSVIGKIARLGALRASDPEAAEFARLAQLGNVNFIVVDAARGQIGHSYFRKNPAVMSDMVLTLAGRERPGTVYRPLEQQMTNVWRLPAGYPENLPDNLSSLWRD
jgi:esterase/lipase superfamily enzyme